MPDGVDENTRIEVPACFGISGTILERGRDGNITAFKLDGVSLLRPPSRSVHYVDIASFHRRMMLSGGMYGGASAGEWSEFDGE